MIEDDLALRLLQIPAVVRYLNIAMISLIVLATVVIHSVSFYYKFIMLAIIIAYTVFLCSNYSLIKLILNLNKHKHLIAEDVPKSWNSLHQAKQQVEGLKDRKEREDRENSKEEEDTSHEKYSRDQINSRREASDVNESFMRVNKHREYRESFGKEFGAEETPKYSKLSMASSFKRSDKTMHLIDRQSMARDSSYQQREDNDKLYQATLREKLQNSAAFVTSRYPTILGILQPMVSKYATDDRANTKKLTELITQYLNVEVIEDESSRYKIEVLNSYGTMHNYHGNSPYKIRATVHYVFMKIWMVVMGMTTFEEAKFKFKDERSKIDFQNKCQAVIQERMKLAEQMGVEVRGLYTKREGEIENFIKTYNKYVATIQNFLQYDLKNMGRSRYREDDVSGGDPSQDSKGKIYILFLFVRHLNTQLDNSTKIKLSDYMNFSQPKYGSYALQIYPKVVYDAYRPHFNVFQLRNGKRDTPLYCEYGEENYLSVIFMVVFWLTRQKQLLRNDYVSMLSRIVQ